MKYFLHTLITLLFAINVQAAENTIVAAQNLAKKHYQNPSLKKTGVKPSSSLRSASNESPSYYIFTDDASDAFCIVDAEAEKVLGYGTSYSDELPSQLQAALDTYAVSPKRLNELRSAKTRENIPSFMDVVFGTRSPYNLYIPDREGYGPPVGCVPVTLAQIAKYYEHPSKLMNDIPAYATTSATNPDTIYQIEGQKAEGRSYNWKLILNHYEKDTTLALNNEIAKLMWDCARSVETRFEQSGSAALTDMFYYSLAHFFGYNSDSLKSLSRSYYYREEWLDIIHEELSKKRPIYMASNSYHNGGHAFICDGYEDGYLHINWGWNGAYNGYFDVDILDYKRNSTMAQSDPANGYSFYERIIIGIEPGEGKTEIELPNPSNLTIRTKDDKITADARFRATEDGFMMYASIDAYKNNVDEETEFALGYADKEGKLLFMTNDYSYNFNSNALEIREAKAFDASYLGKDIKLYILESDHKEYDELTQDTMYDWWHPSDLFEPITISVPKTIENSDEIIEPKDINLLGEYSDSAIVLKIEFQAERPKGSQRYFTLAVVVDGDTLMSESNSDVTESHQDITNYKKTFYTPDMDKEMSLIVLQTDSYQKNTNLKKREWNVCENFKPVTFKLSDCKIFATEMVVDTIIHTTNGRKQKFEITMSNPTPYEFYKDIYFLLDNEDRTGLMIDIPAGETITRIIELESPLLTRYINGYLQIYNNKSTQDAFVYTKDTFGHVFYGLGNGSDETTLEISLLNLTKNDYENTFTVCSGKDTISSKAFTVKSQNGTQLRYSLPVIVSDTDFIDLGYRVYSIYDKDENVLGHVSPLDYYGSVHQSFVDGEKIITINLLPIMDSIMPTVYVGITSSLEKTHEYQRFKYDPRPNQATISIDFKLSDYCTLEKPKYFGLCKEDGTFYAYMELIWDDANSLPNIPSAPIAIIAVDGGIWITSDMEIPSLSIYNVEGKFIKAVRLKPSSSLFVPLEKGMYVVGNNKVLVKGGM